ncbi:MAG: DUF5011 domain-containing protein [Acidimicrobiia bacterium]|nr:DUF5011 domain-containing protein [Acidimicrobiia bacterium]
MSHVTDANGNNAVTVTRTVDVVDTTVPVITLSGADPVTIEVGSPYVDAGATAFDIGDGNLTGSIITVNPVNTAVVGSYVVTYDVSDASGNAAVQVTRAVDVVDTTVPVIALSGANPQIVEVGSPYVELGATASDNYDGDLPGSIAIDASAVSTAVVGSYTVTYDVSDANGNAAVTVSRIVDVVDTTVPVISLTGANPQTIEVGSPYVELGATASDTYDGDISGSIVINATAVNTSVVGSYPVFYDVTDAAGNPGSAIRTVNVVDTTIPVVALTGANPQTIEVGSSYTELGASASDNYDGDISGSILIDATGVDTNTVASYVVTYDVTDANGNNAVTVTRTVDVVDTTVPVITLSGADPQTIEVGSPYVELGATASDNYDGDISGIIVIDATGVTNTVGSYVVTYDVSDINGNAAVTVTRTVDVVDTTIPVVTLSGANPQTIEVGSPYAELGATASDNYDGDLSGSISIDASAVDTAVVGSYSVTYDVTDANGNAAVQVTRTVDVVDTGVPVIIMLGVSPVTVEVGSAYLDPGATAFDIGDGNLTASIVTVNPVDPGVVGTYGVTYDVVDSQGNAAVQLTRTVNVVDTTIPAITLTGANPQVIEVGTAYLELGATALDNYDGDLSGSIVIDATSVNTGVVGAYTITYDVSDANGNAAAAVTRTVNVVDTTVPVITRLGASPQTIEVGTGYTELGATALDNYDGDLSGHIVIDATGVDASTVGAYTVTYDVADLQGNAAVTVTRTVNVVDTTVPVITLVGADPVTIEVGSPYVDAGATAFDIGDGDLTGSIVTVNPVNTAVVGAHTITYDVSDTNGNPAATVVRMVNVVDTTIPVITLIGANPQTIEVGSVYSELGATAFDNYDGDVTASIVINSGVVNTTAVGSYAVIYDVTDAAGNPSSAVRVVDVVDTGLPVITLIGANPQTIQVGATYAELGATAFDANDGNLSSAIVIDASAVNPAVVGPYPVTYDVSDAAGNAAVRVTRTVNVVDATAPAISLLGANPLVLEAGSPFVDPGASAFDAYDGDISGSIVVNASLVNTSRLGSYPVTYNVADSEGNLAPTVTRTVRVVDTTPPVITLVGPNPLSLFVGGIYLEPGASAIDGFDGTISGSIVVDVSALNLAAAGTYPIFYSVVDSSGNPATAIRLVSVVVPNSPPIAVDDRYTVNDVGEIGVPAPGVMGNDTDIDGDALTVTLVSAPNFGELVLNPSGSFTYTYDGLGGVEDVFIYQVSDGRGGSSRAAVRIVVPVLNQPPVAEDHTAVINEDGVARILVTDGYDAEGDPVVLAVTRQPAAGTASADHGAIVFLPPADWFGEASIGYSLTDSFGSVASGSVSVVVNPVNDPPRAGSDVIVLASYLASILDVLHNDYDVEGETLTIVSVTQGEHGTVELVDGKVLYTPHTGWVGTDNFTYTVSDPNGATTVVDVSAEVVSSALITAIGLSGIVGTGLLEIDPPEPLTLARVALDTPHAIRLFTQAFFQSLSAMQLPLVLLLFAALWFLVGGTPWATGLLARRRHWAVVWVGPEDKLNVYTEPSERSSVAFKLLPNARGLVSIERPVRDAETGTVWLPVSADIGHGWVNRANVTEDVDSIEFASDLRPNRLVDRLARLRRRGIGSGLLDGRGMFVALNGQAVNVPGDQVLDILTNDHGGEAPSLLELFLESWRSSNHELAVDAPLERSHLIPAECKNYHYLSVRSPGSPGWMIFFEYRRGRARIAGLGAEA